MMSSILDMFGGDIVEAGIREVGKWANKDLEKMKLEKEFYEELAKGDTELLKKQSDINIQEAKSPSLFIAGWRPFLGWLSAFALGYAFILQPFLNALLKIWGIEFYAEIDTLNIYNIVLSMLGIAGLRTYEKFKKIDTKEIR